MEVTSKTALCAENLTKRYRGASPAAVDGLTLEIREGEIFGLLGPNGAGKTTAISMLSTILKPDRGAISICGIDTRRRPREVRRRIGLVPQDIALYPELTARENLSFFARLHGLRGGQLSDGILQALSVAGLTTKADQKVSTYSGGMKRRLNLAAGIVHSPRFLFLDEPTVGIDAQSRGQILDKLREIKQSGTTMLYTTHYMEEAETLCDRVAIMDRGKLLVSGTPGELLASHPGCHNLGELFLELTGKELRD
jgi:ABC-2 type transport system ATP-binding protein